MSHFVLKDAFWQILGRLLSAVGGFVVIKLMTPYLGPLRFGDYSTILKYFAIWSALADFGLYVLAIKKLGQIKSDMSQNPSLQAHLTHYYSRFVTSRLVMIVLVYGLALGVAYLIPSYTSNPYLIYGLPIGMLFSASFMIAGIVQLPVQLYAQMHHTSIALTLARVIQIVLLILIIIVLYPHFAGTSSLPIFVFVSILGSVVCSGIAQGLYMWWVGNSYIPFKRIRDPDFTREQMKSNWKYGLAYYLSSFHTLIVLIILSIFFPTVDGWLYVGIWAFALQLMELALIVPSSMANSLLHKIASSTNESKQSALGALLSVILWIACMCCFNFVIWGPLLIHLIGGDQYLTTMTSQGILHHGSDFVLSFLGIVLILSFVKQLFNYIFIAHDLHNKIFVVNLIGVITGSVIGIPLMYYYNLVGGIATQLILELCFVIGAMILAYQYRCMPRLGNWRMWSWIIILGGWAGCICILSSFGFMSLESVYWWIGSNLIMIAMSYPSIKASLYTIQSHIG